MAALLQQAKAQYAPLVAFVRDDQLDKIETWLSGLENSTWRQFFLQELRVVYLVDHVLTDVPILLKLLSCSIKSISAFHLAALFGRQELLMFLLDREIPVERSLKSGTTPLQLAAFAGHLDIVRLLHTAYGSEINRQDLYGWSALHYASCEGHLQVVDYLVTNKADVTLRDKDGTSAAFRAQIYGHESVVNFLCARAGDDELLNVYADGANRDAARQSVRAAPNDCNDNKKLNLAKVPLIRASSEVNSPRIKPDTTIAQESSRSVGRDEKQITDPGRRQESARNGFTKLSKSQTLPCRNLSSALSGSAMSEAEFRKMIRNQLDEVFNDYATPVKSSKGAKDGNLQPQQQQADLRQLRQIFKEEILLYKDSILAPKPVLIPLPPELDLKSNRGCTVRSKNGGYGTVRSIRGIMKNDYKEVGSEYEDVYEILKSLPPCPLPPGRVDTLSRSSNIAPQLPAPRTPSLSSQVGKLIPDKNNLSTTCTEKTISQVQRLENPNYQLDPAIDEFLKKILYQIAPHWKKLASALPLERTAAKTEARIKGIEKAHPLSFEDQARAALVEWRQRFGSEANVGGLVAALERCSLHDVADDVELACEEFTA